jgi:hypothetical protein
VTDLKVHLTKMHRVLLAYEETSVVVYSLNKNREIQQIEFGNFDEDKGRALAVEWVPPDGEQFIVGYSTGLMCFYKAESSGQKPIKTINLKTSNLYNISLNLVNHQGT